MRNPPPFRVPTPGQAFMLYVGACFLAIVLVVLGLVFFPWSIPFVVGGALAEAYWLARWFGDRTS